VEVVTTLLHANPHEEEKEKNSIAIITQSNKKERRETRVCRQDSISRKGHHQLVTKTDKSKRNGLVNTRPTFGEKTEVALILRIGHRVQTVGRKIFGAWTTRHRRYGFSFSFIPLALPLYSLMEERGLPSASEMLLAGVTNL
jgi:hypothetical protein